MKDLEKIGRVGNLKNSNSPVLKLGGGELVLDDLSYGFGMGVVLDLIGSITMDAYSFISHDVLIHTHEHVGMLIRQLDFLNPDGTVKYNLHIGAGVFIGERAIIAPGVTEIAEGTVISTGSVLTKNTPAWSVWAGNPAVLVGYRRG